MILLNTDRGCTYHFGKYFQMLYVERIRRESTHYVKVEIMEGVEPCEL